MIDFLGYPRWITRTITRFSALSMHKWLLGKTVGRFSLYNPASMFFAKEFQCSPPEFF